MRGAAIALLTALGSATVAVAQPAPALPLREQASITEYIQRLPTHPNGDSWLHVLTMIDDPKYLNGTFYTSTHFKLEPDATKFSPTPCRTEPPLPVKAERRLQPAR